MIRVGDAAPEIDAMTSLGSRFVLSQQDGLCTVLYFFPKAFTYHCTRETRYFSDNHVELLLAGASVVGISTDDLSTQCKFAASLDAKFPLIADSDQAISRAYGVLWPLVGLSRRYTFVIGPERVVEAVFHYEFKVEGHRNDVLRFVNQKFRSLRGG
jgi:peroxiredoxin